MKFIILGLLILPFFFVHFAQADDVADLQRQIEERSANIKALEAEIAKYQAEADKTSVQAMTLANTIKQLRATGNKLNTEIRLTQAKISAANLTIKKLSGDITDKEMRINESKQAIAENLRIMHHTDSVSLIQNFLSNKNISEFWDNVQSLVNIQKNLQSHIDVLDGTKLALQTDRNQTEEQKADLSEFANTLTDQQKVVTANTNEQNGLLSETKSQEAAYQQLVAQKKAAKAAFEKELFDYESKLKFILDPSSLPSAGSSPFIWPTDNVYITQLFGRTSAAGRLYASGSHNGVDFRATMGTPVKALSNGTVIGIGNTDLSCPRTSFGQWVLIRYNNGLSAIFAHLSVTSVKEGDAVSAGQVVAYSGNTGYSTGPHLHVSVYASDAVTVQNRPSISCAGKILRMPISAVNAYLDPMLYFPKL